MKIIFRPNWRPLQKLMIAVTLSNRIDIQVLYCVGFLLGLINFYRKMVIRKPGEPCGIYLLIDRTIVIPTYLQISSSVVEQNIIVGMTYQLPFFPH